MQKILICSDKYKSSLTSAQVNKAIQQGIQEAHHPSICDLVNMSDGGDGFLSCVSGLKFFEAETVNALLQPITVKFGYKNNTIYIEVANVIGLAILSNSSSNIMERSSYGIGQLIYTILNSDLLIDKIVLGCGGSSTTDGGFGCLLGLGLKALDINGNKLPPTISSIKDCVRFDSSSIHPRFKKISVDIIADVQGDFLGKNGCVQLFAPQKGASQPDIVQIEIYLTRLEQLIECQFKVKLSDSKYGLCCGGLASIFSMFKDIEYFDGANWVIQQTNLELKIAYCDMVISGEGMLDTTTMHGKLVWQIAKLCKRHQKPLVIISGQIKADLDDLYQNGITCAFSIINNQIDGFEGSEKLITTRVRDLLNFSALI